ncbi:MAG: hypothetical protein WAK43_00925 [Dehalococcoidales bacterium]
MDIGYTTARSVRCALLDEAGVPENLKKKIFFLLSDDKHPTDWAVVEDLSRYLVRLVAVKKLELKYQNSKNPTEKRLADWAVKSWANDWFGKTIFDIGSADSILE